MNGAAESMLPPLLGCGARVLGAAALLPIGWDLVGLGQRITIAAAITLFLLPARGGPSAIDLGDLPFEFIIGAVLALPLALVVECASHTGEIFDTLRGQTLAISYDPLQHEQVPLSGTLAKTAAWALLLSSGAALNLVSGLAESLSAVPLGLFRQDSISGAGYRLLIFIPQYLSWSFAAAIPFAAACLGCEAVIAVLAKQLPGLSFQTEGVLAKLLIAVFLIAAALGRGAFDSLPALALPVLSIIQTV